jgi:hypothetical protein
MDLASPQGEINSLEYGVVLHTGMETTDLKQNVGVGANHGRENKRIKIETVAASLGSKEGG